MIYLVQGMRDQKARLGNHGEKSKRHWCATQKCVARAKKEIRKEGFDRIFVQDVHCPKNKQALLDLLRRFAK